MFDKAEAEYTELSGKKRIVETDKAKIEKVLPAFQPVFFAERCIPTTCMNPCQSAAPLSCFLFSCMHMCLNDSN